MVETEKGHVALLGGGVEQEEHLAASDRLDAVWQQRAGARHEARRTGDSG